MFSWKLTTTFIKQLFKTSNSVGFLLSAPVELIYLHIALWLTKISLTRSLCTCVSDITTYSRKSNSLCYHLLLIYKDICDNQWWICRVMNEPDDEYAGDEPTVMIQPWWMRRVMNRPATYNIIWLRNENICWTYVLLVNYCIQ